MNPPNKPSELLLLALKDLEKAEKNPSYQIDMNCWVYPTARDFLCHVCLAGSVMIGTLNMPLDRGLDPTDFDEEWQKRLYALDQLREGEVEQAAIFWPVCEGIEDRLIVPYGVNRDEFFEGIRQMISEYEEADK